MACLSNRSTVEDKKAEHYVSSAKSKDRNPKWRILSDKFIGYERIVAHSRGLPITHQFIAYGSLEMPKAKEPQMGKRTYQLTTVSPYWPL